MSKRIRALTVAGAALTLAYLGATVIHGQEPLPPKGKGEPMRGTWGFSASGTIVPPPPLAPTPAAAVGVITFEPTGECRIDDTINIGGTIALRTSDSCSYVLQSGRGTIVAIFGDGSIVPLSFVLVDHERELRFIRTDLGVAEGVAKLQ